MGLHSSTIMIDNNNNIKLNIVIIINYHWLVSFFFLAYLGGAIVLLQNGICNIRCGDVMTDVGFCSSCA